MRVGHLVRFVGGSLLRQKGRTLLTLVGVAVGATSLAFTLALGLGLRAMVDREFETRANFWDVTVLPADGGVGVPEADVPPDRVAVPPGVTGERRDRLRSGLVRAYQRSNPRTRARIRIPQIASTCRTASSSARVAATIRTNFVVSCRIRDDANPVV